MTDLQDKRREFWENCFRDYEGDISDAASVADDCLAEWDKRWGATAGPKAERFSLPLVPVKRTCGGCEHFRDSGTGQSCHNMRGHGPGQGDTTLDRPSTDRDATRCERWEPKP